MEGACDDDLARMMKGNLKAVIQLLSRYLPEYRMSLLTTKCLNTAVMVMYLALGDAALVTTRQCDVETVRRRRRRDSFASRGMTYDDQAIARRLKQRVLDPSASGRELHYVMLTDGNMPRQHDSVADAEGKRGPKDVYFPGHVFVIESFPDPQGGNGRRHRFYQSYINHYDVVQHTAMMHSSNGGDATVPDIRESELARILDGLIDMAARPVWDPAMTAFWSWFARVPRAHAAQFEGYRRSGIVLMCHRHVKADRCARSLRSLAERALKDTEAMRGVAETAVWGDASLYDAANGAKPLTIKDMREVLMSWVKLAR
jgi:hypothetical protein